MRGNRATLALSFLGFVLAECLALGLMLSMYTRRKSLLVRARSPALAMVQGGCLMVLFAAIIIQEIMRAHDIAGYPCSAMMWASVTSPPMYLVALELRALRVVIVSNASYRIKYSKLASSKTAAAVLAGAFVACVAVGFYLQFTSSDKTLSTDYCYSMQPWSLLLAIVVALTYPTIWLNRKLVKARDKLKMGQEIINCYVGIYVCCCPLWLLLALRQFGVIDLSTAINYLITALLVFFMAQSFVFTRSAWGKHSGRWYNCWKEQKRVHTRFQAGSKLKWRPNWQNTLRPTSVYCANTSPMATNGTVKCGGESQQWMSSVEILKDPTMHAAYSKYVERFLCYESYKFLEEAIKYSNMPAADASAHFKAFVAIKDSFIAVDSAFEVNISTALRNQILSVNSQTAFSAMEAAARSALYKPQIAEVSRMLDQNLISSFHRSKEFAAAHAQLAAAAAAAVAAAAADGASEVVGNSTARIADEFDRLERAAEGITANSGVLL